MKQVTFGMFVINKYVRTSTFQPIDGKSVCVKTKITDVNTQILYLIYIK
jgi:hypothetical protein